jgi:hypothetical protein
VFGKGAERGRELLAVNRQQAQGWIDLTADAYPYNAGYTGIAILFPEWALPPTDYKNIVATRRAELAEYLEKRMTKRGGPEAMLFGSEPYAGHTLQKRLAMRAKSYVDFLIELGPEGGEGAHFTIDEATQDVLFGDPGVAVCTDGSPGMRHPRSTGTYAKLFERYVREKGVLTVEQAVRKATGHPSADHAVRRSRCDHGGSQGGTTCSSTFANVVRRSSYVDVLSSPQGSMSLIVNGIVAVRTARCSQADRGCCAAGSQLACALVGTRPQLLMIVITVEHAPLLMKSSALSEQSHAVHVTGLPVDGIPLAARCSLPLAVTVDGHQVALGDDVVHLHAHVGHGLALFACGGPCPPRARPGVPRRVR